MNCPFCSPIVENATFASSENFLAVYNIAPILPGHTLIIPRKHLTNLLQLDDNYLFEMMSFSKKIICLILEEFLSEGYDFTIQDGESAGQTIEHLHAHIVPRYSGDLPDPGDWYPLLNQKQDEILDSFSRKKITDVQMQKIIHHLKIKFDKLR